MQLIAHVDLNAISGPNDDSVRTAGAVPEVIVVSTGVCAAFLYAVCRASQRHSRHAALNFSSVQLGERLLSARLIGRRQSQGFVGRPNLYIAFCTASEATWRGIV